MAISQRLSNPYGGWTIFPYFYTSDPNVGCGSADSVLRSGAAEGFFSLSAPANYAFLSVWNYQLVGWAGMVARGKVMLKTPGGEITLYEYDGTHDWQAVFNGSITSYLNQAGDYSLALWGEVKGVAGNGSWVWFGGLSLMADTDPPGPPTGLNLERLYDCIRTRWGSVQGATSYNVYYKEVGSGSWTKVSGITGLHYDILGLANCTYYDIKVSAQNVSGEGNASGSLSERMPCEHTKAFSDSIVDTEWFGRSAEFVRPLSDSIAMTEVFEALECLLLLDSMVMTEAFSAVPTIATQKPLSDGMVMSEGFTILKIEPFDTSQEKILLFETDKGGYQFTEGTPYGTYDIGDVDFGQPGKDKTLERIQVRSSSLVPRTVSVYVSTDSGRVWRFVGTCVVYQGKLGFVYPWITAELFRVRFVGSGLTLDSYILYAVPLGKMEKGR